MMAEASVMSTDTSKFSSSFKCSICSKTYTNPKTLPCLHSFCLECLRTIGETSKDGEEMVLTCPECEKKTKLATKSLEDIPNAFQINRKLEHHTFMQKVNSQLIVKCEKCSGAKTKAVGYCVNCSKFICDLCFQIHTSWSELQSHKTLRMAQLKESCEKYIPSTSGKKVCQAHKKECTVYCETCELLICHDCILTGHREHQYFHSDQSAKRHKKEVIEQLDSINHLPVQLQTAISVLDTISQNFSVQGNEVETELMRKFEALQKAIVARRDTLKRALRERLDSKLNILQEQKESMERIMTKLSSCINFVSQTVDGNHVSEFFLLEKQMLSRISELNDEFTKMDLTPIEEPEVHFTFNQESIASADDVGSVSDASILYSGSSDSRVYVVGEVICFYVALSTSFYKMKTNPMDEIQAVVKSVREGTVCPATVAVSSSGFAKLQCTFSDRGRYTVSVKIGGRHVSKSPFTFFIQPNGSQAMKPIKTIEKLQGPKAIAINSKNHIVVCEENRHVVNVFGRKTKKLASIGCYGRANGQFHNPTGVAVDDNECLYVTDSRNNRIQKFSSEGSYLGQYAGDRSNPSSLLNTPSSIKLGPKGQLYVVDRGNSRIVVLSQDLKFVSSFGSVGYGLGQLQDPWDLAFDKEGFVYITDARQHCVQIFTPAGLFRGRIGTQGMQKGKLNRPTGIAIDSFGKIYVCESGNHRVSIFHTSSEFLECFSVGLKMVNPSGIAVDSDGFIYVSCAESLHVF